MALSYYYEFTAPATTTASELETFLRGVEREARIMGFKPTTVLNVPFDTPERREFAHRLSGFYMIEDQNLQGAACLAEGQLRDLDALTGRGRLIPIHGVVLVLTDEHGCETCFGFFQYPERIVDVHGKVLTRTNFRAAWEFRNFVDTPDPRYREVVRMFAEAGYLAVVKDEYA